MNRLPVRSPLSSLWSLQRAVDRLFDDELLRSGASESTGSAPAVDMYETDDAIVVQATVPGFKPEDIQVSIIGNSINIRGQLSEGSERKERNYIFRERRVESFSRTLSLPHGVGADAKAEFENGVLTLTLPKPEEVKPKTIQVQVK